MRHLQTGKCECGVENDVIAPRIFDGEIVEDNSYPWMAAIFFAQSLICGGSLINDRYIITAGHCLDRLNKKYMKVFLGVSELNETCLEETKCNSEVEIDEIIIHEEFKNNYLHDLQDIGLIKLKHPVNFSDEISPVCLPKADVKIDTRTGVIAGWGTTENNTNTKSLRKANLKVITNDECKNISEIGESLLDSMFCASHSHGDACQGDSGGPLTIENNNKMEQIGIISWGIECSKPGIPGVYTRITSFLDWIMQKTEDAIYCKK